jgi:hypothetical protein
MRPVVTELLEYVEHGNASGSLEKAIDIIGPIPLRIIAIKLLGWLREIALTGKYRPLTWNNKYDWCNNFLRLHELIPEFADTFRVGPRHLNLAQSITPQEQNDIIETVNARYRPKLREAEKGDGDR